MRNFRIQVLPFLRVQSFTNAHNGCLLFNRHARRSRTCNTIQNMNAAKLEILAGSLYDTIASHGDEFFNQGDLLSLGIIPHDDLQTLLQVVSYLVDRKLLIPYKEQGSLRWRVRSRQDAAK
jgi:hypothetical protein